MTFLIDHAAKEIARTQWVLPECLHIPVAAVDEAAIETYIGEVEQVLAGGSPPRALLVKTMEPPPIDPRLPIWGLASSSVFRLRRQVWVHVAFSRYRNAYRRAFPEEPIHDKVLSHLMNRRVAVVKGFAYIRLTPTSRGCNSSSVLAENWGVALYSKPGEIKSYKRRGAFIHYADLADLMVMLDLKIGGGVMAAVNEGQKLVRPRTAEA
jgi:hypothetical protein